MSQPGSKPDVPVGDPPGADVPYAGVEYSTATAWVGWVLLGGILLVLFGALHVGAGLVALFRPDVLAASRADVLLPVGLTALAWGHVVLGIVAGVVGMALIRGRRWGRVAAILLACLSAIVNFVFVGVYPIWSVTAIALTAIVIYAVAAHGSEVADAYGGS
jgi:hypothetical protein